MKLERHVFGKLGKLDGELERALMGWLKVAVALAGKKWAKVLPFDMTMACKRITAVRPAEALMELPSPPVALRIGLPCGTPTLLALPRPVVQALVGGLLGDGTGTLPSDAELTSVEASLLQYFFEEYVLPALEETSPVADPVVLSLERLELNPQWSRAFMDVSNLAVCTFTLTGPFGEHACQWLLPLKGLMSVVGEIGEEAQAADGPLAQSAANIAPLVHDLPVEISVVLGTADVSLTQLAHLVPGDMVILNQRVSEPLSASIGGNDKFRGWAGRIGTMQAFQIKSLTDTR